MLHIRKIRRALDMTQQELARKLGVTQATVAQWESGKTTPPLKTILKLAAALGVTVDELISEREVG